MKKSDLKTGMIVEIRSGETALVVIDNCHGKDGIIFNPSSWSGLDAYGGDLRWTFLQNNKNHYCDIMKVYKPDLPTGFLSRTSKFSDNMALLWERKPEKTILKLDGIDYTKRELRNIIKNQEK